MSDSIQVILNGKEKSLHSGLNLSTLLDYLEVNRFTVVVEHNERVIKRAELEGVAVHEGDKIEILRIIGGGSSARAEDDALYGDNRCDICSAPMEIHLGRFGRFMRCTNFPDCKYTSSMVTNFSCPENDCNGRIVEKRHTEDSSSYGCSNYPACQYSANELPNK